MIPLVSPLWDGDGRTADGYRVRYWHGAVSGRITVRVDLPPGGPFRAVATGRDGVAQAAAWAEQTIRDERARCPSVRTRLRG